MNSSGSGDTPPFHFSCCEKTQKPDYDERRCAQLSANRCRNEKYPYFRQKNGGASDTGVASGAGRCYTDSDARQPEAIDNIFDFRNNTFLLASGEIPAAKGEYKRIELRSPDPTVNPYLAYALLIRAGLDGIEKNMQIPEAVNVNLYKADKILTDKLETLPSTLAEAKEIARNSDFIQNILGANVTDFLSL